MLAFINSSMIHVLHSSVIDHRFFTGLFQVWLKIMVRLFFKDCFHTCVCTIPKTSSWLWLFRQSEVEDPPPVDASASASVKVRLVISWPSIWSQQSSGVLWNSLWIFVASGDVFCFWKVASVTHLSWILSRFIFGLDFQKWSVILDGSVFFSL